MKHFLVAGEPECRNEVLQPAMANEIEMSTVVEPRSGGSVVSPIHSHKGGIHPHKSLRSLLRSVKEEAEKNAIASALEETGWNRKAAARLLKTSYRTVLYKIEQYQMNKAISSGSQVDEEADLAKGSKQ